MTIKKNSQGAVAQDKPRVLIIDDNKDIANMQSELLKFYGYDTIACYDGLAALSAAEGYGPLAALVDIGLPIMDGYEVAKKLRRLEKHGGKKIKLIAITGFGQEEDKRRSEAAGFDHHLVKPVDIDLLLKILKNI